MSDEKPMGQVVQIDEARIRDHLGEMVRGTVEETLNAMLDTEAGQLCGAGRYERSQARQDTRAGSYDRTLQTSAGEVNLKIPKLRRQTFETATSNGYRRRESSVDEESGGDFGALWRASLKPCGARGYRRRPCRILTRRFMERSRPGAIGRLRANIRMYLDA